MVPASTSLRYTARNAPPSHGALVVAGIVEQDSAENYFLCIDIGGHSGIDVGKNIPQEGHWRPAVAPQSQIQVLINWNTRLCSSVQNKVSPEEDARLPILEAEIEREWSQHRSGYLKSLKQAGTLKKQLRETASDRYEAFATVFSKTNAPNASRHTVSLALSASRTDASKVARGAPTASCISGRVASMIAARRWRIPMLASALAANPGTPKRKQFGRDKTAVDAVRP